ncbi:uncharacterized protein LODBEIA_P58120 [Lodderomyces beijingensis]|uniref:ethanolamine kinase n=1 Tax=Lodderomyces beijingensis TaxID=1775926 RepID=A0ABP0ZTW8_9ASCO
MGTSFESSREVTPSTTETVLKVVIKDDAVQATSEEFLPAAYCFIQDQKVHFTQIEDDPTEQETNSINHAFKTGVFLKEDADFIPDKLYVKNKNLLYSLNNPSISDVEVETTSNGNSLNVPSTPATSNSNPNSNQFLGTSPPSYYANGNLRSRSPSPSPSPVPLANSLTTHSLYFPRYVVNLAENLETEFQQLKRLILRVFPQWKDADKLVINQVTGGITNMLLSCEYNKETTILIRVYGHGTNLIIDRHREFISHLILNSIELAPQVHARFKNGLIYGFLQGRSLKPEELSNPRIYPLVAQQLGNWHKSLNYKLIEEGVDKIRTLRLSGRRNSFSKKKSTRKQKKRFISNIWELIDDWIEIVPINNELTRSFQQHARNGVLVDGNNLKDVVQQEFHWLKSTLENVNSPVVSCHCDLLSGNVIVPPNYQDVFTDSAQLPQVQHNPVKFIDYEYMLPAPRAFDIANHLAEWQGFNCDRSAIPEPTTQNPVIVQFVRGYLDCVGESHDELKINQLVNEIKMFYGLPGFYWGIWAMIQSEISNIDFDYAEYGKLRLQEYWDWKDDYLKNH